MKFTLFSTLAQKAEEHKKVATVVTILLIAGLCVGGYFGFQEYQRRQSAEYALEQIKDTLRPANPHDLSSFVDVGSVSLDMSNAALDVFPFLQEKKDPERNVNHKIQIALLKILLAKEPSKSLAAKEETEMEKMKKPLSILPPDFIAQLMTGMTVRQTDPMSAILTAKLHNDQLNQTFTLAFSMQKTANGWKVRHLLNAKELTSQLREALLNYYAGVRHVYEEKNAATTKLMETYLPVLDCTANAGVLSDGKTFLMIVHALARNKGNVKITNFNLNTRIADKNGNVLWHRFLNAAKPVGPGEDFNHSWSFELEGNDPLAQKILAAGPLQCHGQWQTVSLMSGRVLQIAEVPNPEEACAREGHDHPSGFCSIPLFAN